MPEVISFNNRIRQLIILLLLMAMVYLSMKELYVFFPGLLGAITLYILSRGSYFRLVYQKKWRPGWTAGMYMAIFFGLLSMLVYLTYTLVEKRLQPFLQDPAAFMVRAQTAVYELQEKTGVTIIEADTLSNLQKRLTDFIPSLLNDTGVMLANLGILLFMLYYMLVHGKEMESFLNRILPLKQSNIHVLAAETKKLVKASALGIPIISLIQGITATIGYVIFGINEYVIWGFLTGVFAFFPVVGTMLIWVPLVIFQYASGETLNATGLMIYSVIVTGNIDYLSRITILKRLGNIHPVVTILGVIIGLGLFGFIGFIFGPLLLTYIILIFRIYTQEFVQPVKAEEEKRSAAA